jgi:hypothetical protein
MRTIAEAMAERAAEGKSTAGTAQAPAPAPAPTQAEPQVPVAPGENQTPVQMETEVQKGSSTDTEVDDIVKRVLSGKPKTPDLNRAGNQPDPDPKFNVTDIDKITDPEAKKYAQEAYKSFEKGYQKKFQELAEERKKLDTQIESSNKWTPEKVQSLLSNQEFINASQAILQSSNPTEGAMSDTEWSALSDKEKSEIKSMKQELLAMKHENQLTKFNAELEKQNSELSSKYSDYDATKVNQLRDGLLAGKIQATNEHLWKVLSYEDAIKKAYLLGKEDRKLDTQVQVSNASPVAGLSRTTQSSPDVKPAEGEDSKSFLKRVMAAKLAERYKKV